MIRDQVIVSDKIRSIEKRTEILDELAYASDQLKIILKESMHYHLS